MAWNHGENERGEIIVEQTFDVREEWENGKDKKEQAAWSKGRKIEPRVKDFGNDSEEELVTQKNNLYGGESR